jgi:hypothetical protein
MHTAPRPAARRFDGGSPSASTLDIPFDVITFRRRMNDSSTVEVTIDRAKLARLIGRRAVRNVGRQAMSFFRAITAVIIEEDPGADSA